MYIIKRKQIDDLEKLISWSQFYQNSDQLAVPRYPKYVFYKNGWPKKFMPESDRIADNKVQTQIEILKAKMKKDSKSN